MKLKEIKNESNNFQILLCNQKILAEELLKEKKERLTRLEKELSDSKTKFLNDFTSNSSVKTDISHNDYRSCHCGLCGQYYKACTHHTNVESNKDNKYYLEVAVTCKEFLLQNKCNELAGKLFSDSFGKIKSNNTKSIFDLVEKIHDCKEGILVLEQNVVSSNLQINELKINSENYQETKETILTEQIEEQMQNNQNLSHYGLFELLSDSD